MIFSVRAATLVDFSTTFGGFEVQLYDDYTPITVANFLTYVENNLYDNTIIHRSIPGFVIQGGAYSLSGSQLTPVPTYAPIQNEAGISNVRGTIAMAKVSGDPNSATSQWFFNLSDNSANLDYQNGGFTVFGKVVGNGMTVVDAIAGVPTYDASQYLGGDFSDLPLLNPALTPTNLVMINSVVVVPEPTTQLLFLMGVIGLILLRKNRYCSKPS
jgi:cyclophilin family peptidyl-prolyl cis-trans isomerase